jgi:hypothetical protein
LAKGQKSFKVQKSFTNTGQMKTIYKTSKAHHVVLPRITSAGQEMAPNWDHNK